MPKNMPFKGSKKLGEEFDPDVVGEEELDFGDYATEQEVDYSGADKIEGSGFDPVANQAKIEEFGTQTVGRVSGRAGTSYSDFIRSASVSKLESMKGMFKGDKEVLNIIDEEISNRAALKTKVPGSPSGIRGAEIAESAAPRYYTESEISKGTAFYKEELATIDKYLTEVEDITPEVRASLAQEAAELETGLEMEKAMFGQSLEEAEAVESVTKAGIRNPKILADLDKPVDKKGKTVLEAMTEDVGKATSEGFVDYTKTQTSSGLTTAKAKSYVRNMEGLWGESKGILGDAGDVPAEKVFVKKGDVLPTGGKAKTEGIRNVIASMPLDDKQIIEGQELSREKTRAEEKIKWLEGHQKKFMARGVNMPETAAELSRLKKDVRNMETKLGKMRKNFMTVAADLPGETFLGKIDKGKAFPVVKDNIGKAGGYGLTAEYQNEMAKRNPLREPKNPADLTKEFESRNPRVSAAMRGAPDPGSPLGVNKPASKVKATDLGDITKSKAYVKKYEETYKKVAIDLSAAAGKVTSNLKDIDPAILKKSAAVAATVAANFAKRNPTISAGLMLFSGLKDFNKPKEKEDYFK